MSDIKTPAFASSEIFVTLKESLNALPEEEKRRLMSQVKAVYEFTIKNKDGKTEVFTVDLKNGQGEVFKGKPSKKADVSMAIGDDDFISLANGKTTGQKLFMAGKLKIRGQLMLANKLDTVFKQLSNKRAKL